MSDGFDPVTSGPHHRKRRGPAVGANVLVVGLTALLAMHLLGGCGGDEAGAGAGGDDAAAVPQGPPPATVRLMPAEQKRLQTRWDAIGRLREIHRAVVAAEVAGRVIEVPVEEGDTVVGGETTLARIDGVWARLNLAEATAAVHSAEAMLSQAQSDLKFLDELQQAGSAKPKEVADQRTEVKHEQARLEAAQAARDRAEQEVQRLAVVAPFDGVVVRKMTEVGQWVDPGVAIAEVVTTGQIDAVVDVPESLVNLVKPGLEVELQVEPLDMRTTGKVVSITPLGAESARTYPVKIRLDDAGGRLKSGMSVVAQIPTGDLKPTLTVPRSAVLQSATGTVVWMAAGPPDGQMAMPQPIRILFGHGDRYAVEPQPTSGPMLAPGMGVVVEGAERLFPTQRLISVDMDSEPDTSAQGPALTPANIEATAEVDVDGEDSGDGDDHADAPTPAPS